MPDTGLPVRKQYRITRVTVTVQSTELLAARVKREMSVPDHPTAKVGERELAQYVRSLTAASSEGARALDAAEQQSKRKVTSGQLAANDRVKITVYGKVVAPSRAASSDEVVLGVAKGDGSCAVQGRQVTPPTPTNPERMARRRPDLPPEK